MSHRCTGGWNEMKIWNSRVDLITIKPASFNSLEEFKNAAVKELLRTERVDMTWLLLHMPADKSGKSPA